jgi:glucose/arabinose dehydrogenase
MPILRAKVIVPGVLVQSHSATLNLCFYTGDQFPSEYQGDIFAAFHGSWNRTKRTGYKVVRVPFDHSTGKPRGEYKDFVTGFVTPKGQVWSDRWESLSPKMVRCSSAKTATARSGA